jgi:tRNA pseudouridine65 synthase
MTIQILSETKDYLVINKPAGVTVHNDPNDVRALLSRQLKNIKMENIFPVHRLDKETSGVLLLALNSTTAKNLATAFQEKTCQKTYVAVLRGTGLAANGVWNQPISDKAEGWKNPQGLSKDRVEAQTRFRVLQENNYFSLIEAEILTGRQHQIRKHATLSKHAIVGDTRYGEKKYNDRMSEMYKTSRMFLHALRLKIPIDGKEHVFEAPLPEEFSVLVKKPD